MMRYSILIIAFLLLASTSFAGTVTLNGKLGGSLGQTPLVNPIASPDYTSDFLMLLDFTEASGDFLDKGRTSGSTCGADGTTTCVADNFDAGNVVRANDFAWQLPPDTPASYYSGNMGGGDSFLRADNTNNAADIRLCNQADAACSPTVTTGIDAGCGGWWFPGTGDSQTNLRYFFHEYVGGGSGGWYLACSGASGDRALTIRWYDGSSVVDVTAAIDTCNQSTWYYIAGQYIGSTDKAHITSIGATSATSDDVQSTGTLTQYKKGFDDDLRIGASTSPSGSTDPQGFAHELWCHDAHLSEAWVTKLAVCGADGVLCACDPTTPANYATCTSDADCQAGGAAPNALCLDNASYSADGNYQTCVGRDVGWNAAANVTMPACNASLPAR